jgi:hypothetical protein
MCPVLFGFDSLEMFWLAQLLFIHSLQTAKKQYFFYAHKIDISKISKYLLQAKDSH